MISISKVVERLGIPVDYSPATEAVWDGKRLHLSHVKCNEEGYTFYHLSDEDFFHEVAHYLLCAPDRATQKDFGFLWSPHFLTFYGTDRHQVTPASHEDEEFAASILQICMMQYCGLEVPEIEYPHMAACEWFARGMNHPRMQESWELFCMMMEGE